MDQRPEDGRSTWIEGALARYEGPLVSYASRLLGDPHRARDAAQETFLRLVSADRAEVDGHLGPWLFAVCRRHCVDVLRKETRMHAADTELLDRTVGQAEDPAIAAETSDQSSHALGAVAGLPPNQREVVELRFRHGLSYAEIARVTGHSATNVGFLLHVAMKTLRARLHAGDGDVRAGGRVASGGAR
jgi:RNA polymerase sigma-70 factor (ECF subfamily)